MEHTSMKKITIILTIALFAVLNSCKKDHQEPTVQYMPNMYFSNAYEAYVDPLNNRGEVVESMEGQTDRMPVKGTIPRGYELYDLEDTPEGYALSVQRTDSELKPGEYDPKEAEYLYDMYCAICHGKGGKGDGDLVKNEKILGVPSYADRQITKGSIYYVITYGKGVMGSHAAQLSPKERWQIVEYVHNLRSELVGTAAPAATNDSVKAN